MRARYSFVSFSRMSGGPGPSPARDRSDDTLAPARVRSTRAPRGSCPGCGEGERPVRARREAATKAGDVESACSVSFTSFEDEIEVRSISPLRRPGENLPKLRGAFLATRCRHFSENSTEPVGHLTGRPARRPRENPVQFLDLPRDGTAKISLTSPAFVDHASPRSHRGWRRPLARDRLDRVPSPPQLSRSSSKMRDSPTPAPLVHAIASGHRSQAHPASGRRAAGETGRQEHGAPYRSDANSIASSRRQAPPATRPPGDVAAPAHQLFRWPTAGPFRGYFRVATSQSSAV